MSPPSLPVESISDTAFLTAFYRAVESDRSDALFCDPYARILAGMRGEQIFRAIPESESVALGCAVRTCVMDELILRTVKEKGIDLVLNLGAGFDTRPYRLPLPARLRWIEADFPAILTYKQNKLATVKPVCDFKSVAFDVTDAIARQKLFQGVGTIAQPILAVTEGLLVYLTPEQVGAIALSLYAQPSFRWWLIELASKSALQQIEKSMGNQTVPGKPQLQFAPAAGSDFFRQYGWEPVEFHSFFEAAQRLNRGALPKSLLTQLSAKHWEILRKMSGFVLLKRAEP
jgi:methyltransferase (TIGR00027 family)